MRSLLILILILYSNAFAEDGKKLYESHCVDCHSRMTGGDGTVLYQRDDKIVSSMDSLSQRVRHCSEAAAPEWNESDIEAVTNYLNENFYHY
ncbi:MAG: cytochrome c [Pseudomonadota bacterium]